MPMIEVRGVFAVGLLTVGCGNSTVTSDVMDAAFADNASPAADGADHATMEAATDVDASGVDSSAGSDGADAAGSSSDSAEASSDSGGSSDAAADASGTPCGAQTCTSSQLCVYARGGGPASCSPTNDAGACPNGSTYMATCTNLGNQPGCVNDVESPISCVDTPASCGATPSCACLPSTVCPVGTGTCQMVAGSSITCANQ
jgi:hypothetical protein